LWLNAASGTAGVGVTFTQAMTLDASGNLLVGRTSGTGANLDVYESASNDATIRIGNVQNAAVTAIGKQGASSYGATSAADAFLYSDGPLSIMSDNASGVIKFSAGGNTERARITSGGELLVGVTAVTDTPNNGVVLRNYSSSTIGAIGIGHASGVVSGTNYVVFAYNGGSIGSISQNGTTAVAYNTSSDYRLKDNPKPLTGSGAFIDALKPKTWNWKADGSKGVGFIAHEVQEVSPGSVTGEKDGEQMQAMEYGSAEFIANIIAELQSLRARVAALESQA
jgi:hypothetical protein